MFGMCLGSEEICVFCVCAIYTDTPGVSGSLGRVSATKKRALKASLLSEGPLAKGVFTFPGLL